MSARIATCLVLLAAPLLASAGRYQPEETWLEAVRVPEPFLPYRLGVVEFEEGTSGDWLEYLGDLRATLRGANYFQRADAPRLRLQITRGYEDGGADEKGCKNTPGTLALTYRLLDGEREVNRFSITTQAPPSGSDNDLDGAMSGNLKFLLLELRKGQGDGAFAAQAAALENGVRSELGTGSSLGCKVGVVMKRGLVATLEGTVAVAKGVGQVAGVALEVAASPEFQSAMHEAMAEQQRQQAQHQAFMDNINAQVEADRQRREAQQRAEAEQLAAQQQQLAAQQAAQQQQLDAQQAAQQQAGREAMAAEKARADAERTRQEAQRRIAEQQRKAEEAEAERARRRAEELAAREKAIAEERQRREQQKRQDEAALRTAFQGRATTCAGGGSGILYLQTSRPPKLGCNVQFEARCPATQPGNGVSFGQNNYVGGSCMGIGDAIQIGQMSCSADQVRIEMTRATCG
ncbi:hypothetical protein [Cognatilysobacter tabacisoli]|uniref:hypothetical protein n=1 Tax=Cognatilysobacter tabacisoli TaxID=2315424 RepID=UPI000E6B412F|nr:hypothetical protein [Lysobacter tabacisoli]